MAQLQKVSHLSWLRSQNVAHPQRRFALSQPLREIADLAKIPTVFVFYSSGSSGEFLAQTLADSFDSIAKNRAWWEDAGRVKFCDLYGRSFNSGEEYFDDDIVLRRANSYFETLEKTGSLHVGLLHPNHNAMSYFLKNFSHHPVIEITAKTQQSRLFATLASIEKIKHIQVHKPRRFYHDYIIPNCLQIEWQDLMFTPQDTFQKISDFLKIAGDKQKFVDLTEQYKVINKKLFDRVYES